VLCCDHVTCHNNVARALIALQVERDRLAAELDSYRQLLAPLNDYTAAAGHTGRQLLWRRTP
jgi:hypothetical protein